MSVGVSLQLVTLLGLLVAVGLVGEYVSRTGRPVHLSAPGLEIMVSRAEQKGFLYVETSTSPYIVITFIAVLFVIWQLLGQVH